MKMRLDRLREKFPALELDAFFVSSPENRRYLSGFAGSAGFFVISRDAAVLATDFRYTEQAALQAPDFRVDRISGGMGWLPELFKELGVKRRRVRERAHDRRPAHRHHQRPQGGRGRQGDQPGRHRTVHRPAARHQGTGGVGAAHAGDGDRRPRLRRRCADNRDWRHRGVGCVAAGAGHARRPGQRRWPSRLSSRPGPTPPSRTTIPRSGASARASRWSWTSARGTWATTAT